MSLPEVLSVREFRAELAATLKRVQDEDAGPVIEALTGDGFRATRINTVGGFLITDRMLRMFKQRLPGGGGNGTKPEDGEKR